MNDAPIAMGVDVGGTHITAALVNTATRQIITDSVKRTGVHATGSAEEVIERWSYCIKATMAHTSIKHICLAMPGPIDYEEGTSFMQGQNKYECLYGLNIKELLAQSLCMPVDRLFMYNDAACFLQGEVYAGSVAGMEDQTVIGITLGTGLGSAIYKNGKSSSADKWCAAFKDSIAEDYLSTRWFVSRWKEQTGCIINGARELAQLAHSNDTEAQQLFVELGHNLGHFLLDFAATAHPKAIVIGGNIAKAYKLFMPYTSEIIRDRHPDIILSPAALGEHAPLLGSVGFWYYHSVK